jgi:hypothetical protein
VRKIPSSPIGMLMKKIQRQWKVGGDEAAERRAHDRADERRNREGGQRLHDLGFRHAAQDHEAAHGDHHGPAHALEEPRQHEAAKRRGRRAGERARHEHREGRREYVARAEPVAIQPEIGMNTARLTR